MKLQRILSETAANIDKLLRAIEKQTIPKQQLRELTMSMVNTARQIDADNLSDALENAGYDSQRFDLSQLDYEQLENIISELYNFFGGNRQFMKSIHQFMKLHTI